MEVPVEKVETEKVEKQGPRRFSDVYGQPAFDFPGEEIEEKAIRGKEMTIYDIAVLNGTFGEFLVIDAELTDDIIIGAGAEQKRVKRVQFAEGSDVIKKQLKKAKEDKNLPMIAKIVERTSEKTKMTYRTLE